MAGFSKPRGLLSTLFAILLLLQVTVAISHHAHHEHARNPTPTEMEEHMEKTKRLLDERADRIKVTGVLGGTRAERKEVRDLKKNADQWNLYLLGMERFMAKAKSDPLSYYQIAGVHGRPYVTWNGFGPLTNNAGFCPHGQGLFGSWHRPYLAIFEQAWYQCVVEVIATFPSSQRARWTAARQTLRLPYWDWAVAPPSGESNMPTLLRDPTVSVTKPSGKVTINNPLYSYSFGSSLPSEMGGGPWNNWPITLRRPVSNPTRSNNNEVSSMLQSMRTNLRDRVYYLFISKASWGYVSSEQIGARTEIASVDSFESVHDAIHTTVGGDSGGTMYYLDYSAFDPAFWLHHVNIDRLLAMYQKNSPNTWVANSNINRPMAQWNQGEAKNANSPLKPFPKTTKGDYYTSNDIKDTLLLGYYYADAQSTGAMVSAVNNKYSGGRNGLRARSVGEDGANLPYDGRPLKAGDYHTILSIIANKFALEGSYTAHCFLGNGGNSTGNSTAPYSNSTAPFGNSTTPHSNSTGSTSYDYTQSPDYVGSYSVLGGTQTGSLLTEGCVPLTTALMGKEAAGYVKSIAPKDTEDYLKKNLYYKIVGPGGVEYNPEDLEDFHVYVQAAPVTPASSGDAFPELGDYIKLPTVTENLPAGQPYTWVPGPYDYIGYNETPSYEYPAPADSYPSGYPVPSGIPSEAPSRRTSQDTVSASRLSSTSTRRAIICTRIIPNRRIVSHVV
ncbi:hypothetical protein BDV96DRAFT_333833 [Lophiotrema nucula]|uniref:tyrosinase n=1 Tax=Lophiotrema nucula TaxID=690887 RepID=A0A6A5YHD3_9PLEO|nr:hypothetical protein BDV96DRAFT_333833 [Lophiotrema nucula]